MTRNSDTIRSEMEEKKMSYTNRSGNPRGLRPWILVLLTFTVALTACGGGRDRKKDRTPPVVTIESPTTAPNYLTNSSPASLGGTASDNRQVVAVEWENASTGATGVATGTETWTVAIPVVLGANLITMTALDKRGNAGTDTITVTLDDAAPALTIDVPTTSPTYLTDTTPVTLSGTASDNDLVSIVTWENADTVGFGTALGTTSWTVDVPLTPGGNRITVAAEDLAGNAGTDSITITLDVTRPLVVIDTPTTALTYATPWTPLTIGGSAWDDVGVASVAWANAATGGSGGASGIDPWTADVDLAPGANPIVVTVTDGVGRTDEARILLIRCDGTTSAFGENGSGQLGDGTTTDRIIPTTVPGLPGATAVAAGNLHTVALLCDGTVWQWGSGTPNPFQVTDPSDPTGYLTGVVSLAAGSDHTLALMEDGTVRAWGLNTQGQLGDGTVSGGTPFPVQVVDPSDPSGYLIGGIAVEAGGVHSLAILSDGTVRAWGGNAEGQLGDGTTSPSSVPVQVIDPGDPTGFLTDVVDLAAHISYSLAARSDGTVRAWGFNSKGQLGDGTISTRPTPVQVVDPGDPSGYLTAVVEVDAGQEHSLAILADGTVRAWGWNNAGQLGDASTTNRTEPVQVLDLGNPTGVLRGATTLAAGWQFTLALMGDGTVRAWGANGVGCLGDGTTSQRTTPVRVVDPGDPTGFLTYATALAAGGAHSVVARP